MSAGCTRDRRGAPRVRFGIGVLVALVISGTLVVTGVGPAGAAGSTLVAWGSNTNGQLGVGGTLVASTPVATSVTGVLAGKTVTAVGAGGSTSCVVATGAPYCWGNGADGALFDGSDSVSSVPVALTSSGALSGKTVTGISVGGETACAVASGAAYCWGGGGSGQLGNGATANSSAPVAVSTSGVLSGKTVTAISVGQSSVCAVASGAAYCWGSGSSGKLGNGASVNSSVPVAVSTSGVLSGKTVTAISVGQSSVCAVASGAAFCWGAGGSGQLGNGASVNSSVPVAVSTSGVLSGKSVTATAVGAYHACVVAAAVPACWGAGGSGQLGNGATAASTVPVAVSTAGVLSGKTVTAISVDAARTCAVASSAAFCWGSGEDGALGNGGTANSSVPVAVSTAGALAGRSVTGVELGTDHACVVASAVPVCWGSDGRGQLGVGRTVQSTVPVTPVTASGVLAGREVTDASMGDGHACAVASGVPACWGRNASGALGTGDTSTRTTPTAVDTAGVLAGKTTQRISAGVTSTCAVASGAAFCWGAGTEGQLGNGTTANSSVPVAVSTAGALAGKTVTAISAGSGHACAVAGGAAYCWGLNVNGQLGNGSTTNSSVPVAVSTAGVLAGKTVTDISAGSSFTCVVASGALYCWGAGTSGRLGNGATANSSVPVAVSASGVLAGRTATAVAAGSSHACAVATGALYCWGSNSSGGLGNGSTTNSSVPVAVTTSGVLSGKTATRVAVGGGNACAVAGGAAVCWGAGWGGALGNGGTASSSVPVVVSAGGPLAGLVVGQVTSGGYGSLAVAAPPAPVAPGAPTAVAGSRTASQTVRVTFTAPGSTGGSPITDYDVEYSTSAAFAAGTGTFVEAGATTSGPIDVGGLTNGTTYFFRVRASNVVGDGPWSAVSAGVVPFTTPDPPTAVTVARVSSTSVRVSFTAPATGGSPITDYDVEYANNARFAGPVFFEGGTTTASPMVVTGLTTGTGYYFRVRASNAAGDGPWSAASSAITP